VHPEKAPILKRVTVCFGHRHSWRSSSDVSKEATRFHMLAQSAKILIAPSWSNAGKYARCRTDLRRVPTDTRSISVERFGPLFGLEALSNQRVRWPIQQIRQKNFRPPVADEPTHASSPSARTESVCDRHRTFHARREVSRESAFFRTRLICRLTE